MFFAVFGFVLRDNAALRDSLLQLLTSSVPGLIGDKNALVSIDTLLDSTILGWTGIDCGICLAPRRQSLSADESARLRDELTSAGLLENA